MEKLILEMNIGDGYTWSATTTLPILYKSKQDAIKDIENILLEYMVKEEEGMIKINELTEKQTKFLKSLQKNKNNKVNGKKDVIAKEFIDVNSEIENIRNNIIGIEFEFGGQKLTYSDFFQVEDFGKKSLILPEIKTLDEFYQNVMEKSNEKTQKIKIK